jgi:hypothetical protein
VQCDLRANVETRKPAECGAPDRARSSIAPTP